MTKQNKYGGFSKRPTVRFLQELILAVAMLVALFLVVGLLWLLIHGGLFGSNGFS